MGLSSSSSNQQQFSPLSQLRPIAGRLGFIFLVLAGLLLLSRDVSAVMPPQRKLELRELVRKTWDHGFNMYMHHAFPDDELRPLSCQGVGHDHQNPDNHEVNDVLGDFSMTLIDCLDTMVILGDHEAFSRAVYQVINHVPSFDLDVRVQVFETTIRVLGGLLSGHLFAKDEENKWGHRIEGYNDELLMLAQDLADRMLPAFLSSKTSIPYARVNLRHGVAPEETVETCTAGAGSLLLEFATLSRLVNKPIYESVAKKAFYALWDRRSGVNLFGNTLNLQTGHWSYGIASIGAGIDSFYEYILKSYVLLQDDSFLDIWHRAYRSVMTHIRSSDGFWYRGVNMQTGSAASTTIDSLAAFWPGLQILAGDVEAAIQSHMVYANLWKRYSGIPEVFDTSSRVANALGYPQRPEFVESNYFLYRATKDEFYLEMAERVITDLVNRTWVDCGLASIGDLSTGKLEDRMHSFMLSETLKYLYLTFDEDNRINTADEPFIFTTEGHILFLPHAERRLENRAWKPVRPNPKSDDEDEDLTGSRANLTEYVGQSEERPLYENTCPAFLPSTNSLKYSSELKLSVEGRTDFEYAKMITGNDQPAHSGLGNATSNWMTYGLSEVPAVDEHLIELLFTHSGAPLDLTPGPDKVDFTGDRVILKNLGGLALSIHADPHSDGFDVVKIGLHRLPRGAQVLIEDEYAVKALRSRDNVFSQRDRDHATGIRVTYSSSALSSGPILAIERPVMMATFGPDVRIPQSSALSLSSPVLELAALDGEDAFGCRSLGSGGRDVTGKVVLVERGNCTFLEKIYHIAKAGGKGLIVANHEDTLLIPTSDRLPSRDSSDDSQVLPPPSSSQSDSRPISEVEADRLMASIPLLFATKHTAMEIRSLLDYVERTSVRPSSAEQDDMDRQDRTSQEQDQVVDEKSSPKEQPVIRRALVEIIEAPLNPIRTGVVINGYRLVNVVLPEEE